VTKEAVLHALAAAAVHAAEHLMAAVNATRPSPDTVAAAGEGVAVAAGRLVAFIQETAAGQAAATLDAAAADLLVAATSLRTPALHHPANVQTSAHSLIRRVHETCDLCSPLLALADGGAP